MSRILSKFILLCLVVPTLSFSQGSGALILLLCDENSNPKEFKFFIYTPGEYSVKIPEKCAKPKKESTPETPPNFTKPDRPPASTKNKPGMV